MVNDDASLRTSEIAQIASKIAVLQRQEKRLIDKATSILQTTHHQARALS